MHVGCCMVQQWPRQLTYACERKQLYDAAPLLSACEIYVLLGVTAGSISDYLLSVIQRTWSHHLSLGVPCGSG
jgi:hypothetical protein